MVLRLSFFSDLCRERSDGQNNATKDSPSDRISVCVATMYQRDVSLFTLLSLPFSLYLLYHLDRVPDQDSGARTWPRLYLSCAKSWSSPDLPYGRLHQKGVDRMCSCCHGKGKTSLCIVCPAVFVYWASPGSKPVTYFGFGNFTFF